MGEYEDTLKDICRILGIVPRSIKSLPRDVLIQDWEIWKKYIHRNANIPNKYRNPIGVYENKWLNILMSWKKS